MESSGISFFEKSDGMHIALKKKISMIFLYCQALLATQRKFIPRKMARTKTMTNMLLFGVGNDDTGSHP